VRGEAAVSAADWGVRVKVLLVNPNVLTPLDTPARIYYKYEGASPAGSHKLNTAPAQAHFYRRAGVEHVTTGTGAGQWGVALAMVCQHVGLKCTVYMVRCSYTQKPGRRLLMSTYGDDVIPSPSTFTEVGRSVLDEDPATDGRLAIANAEAIEQADFIVVCRESGRRWFINDHAGHRYEDYLVHELVALVDKY
jgi:tryptophan synthase beta chain